MLYDKTTFMLLRYQITARLKFIRKKNVAYDCHWNSASATSTSSDKGCCEYCKFASVLPGKITLLHMHMPAKMFHWYYKVFFFQHSRQNQTI